MGGYREGLYRVPTQLRREVPDQRSGPRKPCKGLEWVGLGPEYHSLGTAAGTAPGPPFGPGRLPVAPSLSRTLRMPPYSQ